MSHNYRGKSDTINIITMPRPKKSNSKTPAERQAESTARLIKAGGKRLSVKLEGTHIKKIGRLIKAGYAPDQQAVIRRLIENP